MDMRVVYAFEAVQIDQRKREASPAARASVPKLRRAMSIETRPVREACEIVGSRQ